MRLAIAVGLSVLVAAPAEATKRPGFFPRPLFGTPGKAAYCYVDMVGFEDARAELFCWTPNDGWGVWIPWNGQRAHTRYFTTGPQTGEDFGILKGYAPRAPLVAFGATWRYRCVRPNDQSTCRAGRGRIAFTCASRSSGLRCVNAIGHGFWIGRYHGYRLF